jgi:hypothetical protein
MKKDMIAVIVLFIAIILLAVWFSSSPAYVAYSSTITSGGPAKYEGFSSLEYSSTSSNTAMDGSIMNYAIASPQENCKSVGGFNGFGIFCQPTYMGKDKVDIFSQAKGSLNGESYGYYNSQGPLQLDENMKKQLSTRGMNAAGSPSTIAGSPV